MIKRFEETVKDLHNIKYNALKHTNPFLKSQCDYLYVYFIKIKQEVEEFWLQYYSNLNQNCMPIDLSGLRDIGDSAIYCSDSAKHLRESDK